jgi:hypothetical protein
MPIGLKSKSINKPTQPMHLLKQIPALHPDTVPRNPFVQTASPVSEEPRNVQGHFRNCSLQNPRRAAGGRPGRSPSRPERRRPYKGLLLPPHPPVTFLHHRIDASEPRTQPPAPGPQPGNRREPPAPTSRLATARAAARLHYISPLRARARPVAALPLSHPGSERALLALC